MIRWQLPLAGAALVVSLVLSGCTEPGSPGTTPQDPGLPQQWTHPTTKPVEFKGTTVHGDHVDSRTLLGKVVVVNFWYAGCPPCRAEAPVLKKLAAERAPDGVEFVGVNTRDSANTAALFEDTYTPGYPNIVDQEGDLSVQLAFSGARGPSTTPATLILDRAGRVVARYGGQINESVLNTLISDAVDGKTA